MTTPISETMASGVEADRPGRGDEQLGSYIRGHRLAAQCSLRQLARTAGVSNPYLSQIERGIRKPSAEILQAIAKALGISAEVLYVRAGILEERVDGADVERAIDDDPRLTPSQRRALREVYRAFLATSETAGP